MKQNKVKSIKFKIGKKISPHIHKNEYRIIVNFMYGDADGDGKEEVFISKDSKDLERFIRFLKESIDVDRDTLQDIKDFDYFCDEYHEEGNNTVSDFNLDWHYDPTCEGDRAIMNYYEITYFDHNGDEFEVKVTGA